LTPEPAKIVENSPFLIDGRSVQVTLAISRSEANTLTEEKKVKQRAEDKRNLYLIKEGVIFPDSEAAKSMTPSELSRRQTSYSERKRLLATNPNLFISKTRLSVRNLNLKVDDKLLKSTAQESVLRFWEEVEQEKRQGLEEEVLKEAAQSGYKDPSTRKKIIVKQVNYKWLIFRRKCFEAKIGLIRPQSWVVPRDMALLNSLIMLTPWQRCVG